SSGVAGIARFLHGGGEVLGGGRVGNEVGLRRGRLQPASASSPALAVFGPKRRKSRLHRSRAPAEPWRESVRRRVARAKKEKPAALQQLRAFRSLPHVGSAGIVRRPGGP